MALFEIPDIRLFWSDDTRFKNQFKDNQIKKFEPYSKYPACYKDVTFYLPDNFEENDFFEALREVGGDLIEDSECVDTFENKKIGKTSKCFRVNFRSMDRNLTNEEVIK